MSSAISLNLDQSKILSSGNGLNMYTNNKLLCTNNKVLDLSNFKAF